MASKEPVLTPYQIKEIETASPEQILLILYDGAIRFLNLAKQGFHEHDFETFNNLLIKTQRIIRELIELRQKLSFSLSIIFYVLKKTFYFNI